MGNAIKNIMLRAIGKRLSTGDEFDEIIKDYPGLIDSEINELKKELTE